MGLRYFSVLLPVSSLFHPSLGVAFSLSLPAFLTEKTVGIPGTYRQTFCRAFGNLWPNRVLGPSHSFPCCLSSIDFHPCGASGTSSVREGERRDEKIANSLGNYFYIVLLICWDNCFAILLERVSAVSDLAGQLCHCFNDARAMSLRGHPNCLCLFSLVPGALCLSGGCSWPVERRAVSSTLPSAHCPCPPLLDQSSWDLLPTPGKADKVFTFGRGKEGDGLRD